MCALRAPRQWVGSTGRQGSVRHYSKLFPTSGIREQSPIETYQVECFPGLAPEEPNISVILIDDVGNGLPSTYGREVHTPALDRIAGSVIVVPTISDIVVTQKETNIAGVWPPLRSALQYSDSQLGEPKNLTKPSVSPGSVPKHIVETAE